MTEVEEDLESPLTIDFTLRIAPFNRVAMIFSDEFFLDNHRLVHIKLHLTIVGWRVDRSVEGIVLLLLLVALVILLVALVLWVIVGRLLILLIVRCLVLIKLLLLLIIAAVRV